MTVEEIFKELSANMLKGVMLHEELANYYDFLGLKGYKRCHEYHFIDELCDYRNVCRYYINHYNKLLPPEDVERQAVIPDSWFSHVREDVDAGTKKNAVKNGLNTWVEWERDTKKLYQKLYKELLDIDEIAAASMVLSLVEAVDCELKKAERYLLNKTATGFDMLEIIQEQRHKHNRYKKLIEKEFGVYFGDKPHK